RQCQLGVLGTAGGERAERQGQGSQEGTEGALHSGPPLTESGPFANGSPRSTRRVRSGHPSETVGAPGLPALNFQPRRGKEISGSPSLWGYVCPLVFRRPSFPINGLARPGSP